MKRTLPMTGLMLALLVACQPPTTTPTPLPPTAATATNAVPATFTPLPASATPEALAARVNEDGIALADYDREVHRCELGLTNVGKEPGACRRLVLDTLIDYQLMAQAAHTAGITVSADDVAAAIQNVVNEIGGGEAYNSWLSANDYTDAEYRAALTQELVRERMVAQVTDKVGTAAPQVHARALLVTNEDVANTLHDQLLAGADFATLAVNNSMDLSSRPAGGDLGWFPRGVLTVPAVEEAAFALAPNAISVVIKSPLGYHIVQTLEADANRPLSPGAQAQLRANVYQQWLAALRAEAQIEIIVTP